MKNKKLFWIGIQESEIKQTYELFAGSITIFGSGKDGNFAFDKVYNLRYNYNHDNDLWFEFVNMCADKIILQYPDCAFVLYYPMDAVFYNQQITSRLIGANDSVMLDAWDNKFRCREWLGNDIPTVENEIKYGHNIIENGANLLRNGHEFVIQGEYSCGGSDTWLLTESSRDTIFAKVDPDRLYSLSPYIEHNISVNIHLIIYSNEVIILPASIQLIDLNTNSFEYQGADFIAYRHLPQNIKDKVIQYSSVIGERLRRSGYLGVCGVDYITTEQEVYFSEINPRFQSSTFLLNYALNKNRLDYSIQQLHLDAFFYSECQYSIPSFDVDYSYYKVVYSTSHKKRIKNLSKRAIASKAAVYIDDKLSWDAKLEEKTYLYKLLFTQNICAVAPDYKLIIHSNLDTTIGVVIPIDLEEHILELKVMLLAHGITLSANVQKVLEQTIGINHEEFDAIDLIINGKYYINVPYCTNLTELSPFQIKIRNGQLWLFYCEEKLTSVVIRGTDHLANEVTKSGLKYSEVCYLGHDRLRLYHRLGCFFKENSCSCGFCDLDNDNRVLTFDTITEVISAYANCSNINHYLIGGGSQNPQDDYEHICNIAKYLKLKTGKPIYLMSLPVHDEKILKKLKLAGITEVAFNIEVFNRKLAKKYMPGKGAISLQTYYAALKKAVKLWGNTGNVRSIIIVGLEPKESLLKGIEELCKIGVSPILSLLKPISCTPLQHMLPPCDKEILDIVIKAEQICKKYNIALGPSCRYCEDNTLKITR